MSNTNQNQVRKEEVEKLIEMVKRSLGDQIGVKVVNLTEEMFKPKKVKEETMRKDKPSPYDYEEFMKYYEIAEKAFQEYKKEKEKENKEEKEVKEKKDYVSIPESVFAPRPKAEVKEEEQEGPCYCSECFNFNTFEEVLKDQKGIFDYTSIVLNGNTFNIKYFCAENGSEQILMQRAEDKKPSSKEDLLKKINEAVQARDFGKAQDYLIELNNLKK